MEVKKLDHIAIICRDYEKAKDFYIEKLGMKMILETKRIDREDIKMDLEFGSLNIELFIKSDAPKRPTYPEASGFRHLSLKTSNIEKDVEELTEKGIKVEPIRLDELNQRKMTFFFDPDDLPIELHE